MRAIVRLSAAVIAAVALAGCFFDQPLTSTPSKNINTWLLGVWESTGADGRVSRLMVTPIDNSHYAVELELAVKGRIQPQKYQFEAWQSRVGDTVFLTLKSLQSPGDIPAGAFGFVQVQLLNQNAARVRTLQLDSAPSASSYALRREVRQRLKDKTLYGDKVTDWTRVAEVFWSNDGQNPVFSPLRNPTL